ncbi:MAG: response regulator [Chroococcidiopsidaceae cyanobacterium CP_BM_ER_R8_30]|nr:response regulator [Chroococcidiopsidaceae cyanobacterium CP_BM_ER_R8_30]
MSAAKILVVEDEVITSTAIKEQLNQLGYTVVDKVASGSAAIKSVAKSSPDLVLMDITLKKGDIDGVTAAARIREEFKIPVVYLTAHSDEATLDRAKVTEAFGYIIKPFADRDLRIAIEMALNKHRAEQLVEEATAQKLAEHERTEAQIKASLQEKEVLLKEVHHRVKNNFQIISSLLSLQSNSIQDERCREVFKISQNRIESMALVHEKLYLSENLAQIDFADYIKGLVADLMSSYQVDSDTIDIRVIAERAFLSLGTAIACGLIINELVLNAFKYGFPEGRSGEVYINFCSEDDGKFSLAISDNGIGFPQDLDFKHTESLGLQLVNALTAQLGGTIELNRDKGTEYKITFTEMPREGVVPY